LYCKSSIVTSTVAEPPTKNCRNFRSIERLEFHGLSSPLVLFLPKIRPSRLRSTRLVDAFPSELKMHLHASRGRRQPRVLFANDMIQRAKPPRPALRVLPNNTKGAGSDQLPNQRFLTRYAPAECRDFVTPKGRNGSAYRT
jgi:hypothetical protein